MGKYYKVNLNSLHKNINNRNIIVKSGIIYAKEIMTNEPIMICDNDSQGFMHNYYVLKSDLSNENMATLDDVKKYIENYNSSPFISENDIEKEQKEIDKFLKEKKKKVKYFKANVLSCEWCGSGILGFGNKKVNIEKTIILKKKHLNYRELCTNIEIDLQRDYVVSLGEVGKKIVFVRLINGNVSKEEIDCYVSSFDYDEFERIFSKDEYYKRKVKKKGR